MDPNFVELLGPTAWTAAVLGFAGFLLYAVGGTLDHADLLLLVLGALPVAGLGLVAFRSPEKSP